MSIKHLGIADNNAKAMFEDFSGNVKNYFRVLHDHLILEICMYM